jgi:hypothetical protein
VGRARAPREAALTTLPPDQAYIAGKYPLIEHEVSTVAGREREIGRALTFPSQYDAIVMSVSPLPLRLPTSSLLIPSTAAVLEVLD